MPGLKGVKTNRIRRIIVICQTRHSPRKGAAAKTEASRESVRDWHASSRRLAPTCHAEPTRLGIKDIGDGTTSIGERRGAESTGEEAEDEERLDWTKGRVRTSALSSFRNTACALFCEAQATLLKRVKKL